MLSSRSPPRARANKDPFRLATCAWDRTTSSLAGESVFLRDAPVSKNSIVCGMLREGFIGGSLMRTSSPASEQKCDACHGTGFAEVKQPTKPGHKIYPPRCTKCGGKGRIAGPNAPNPKGP